MASHVLDAVRRFRFNAIVTALVLCGGAAGAIEIDVGNPDVSVQLDTTVRYNLGVRVESPDRRILANPAFDESNSKFDRGDIVSNRLDLLSQLDISYRRNFGLRLSGAAWYDHAYRDHRVRSPAASGLVPTSYFNDTYNSRVRRFVHGPSAEILDAFVWGNFNLGAVPVNVRLGRHTQVWGEGLLLGAHAISYSQAPIDGGKAVASPGIETKEVFMPLNQLSFRAQLTDNVTLMGQYFLEWSPTRVPHGGTFLMGADTSPTVDRLGVGPGLAANRVANLEPGDTGNWGIGLRWNVDAIQSTLGVYYRRFNSYNPETGIQFTSFTGPLPTGFRFVYPTDTTLIGVSLARGVGPVSVGVDVSLRQNTHLNSVTTYGPATNTGARGDTLHAVVNGVYLLPSTALWDTGNLIVEMAYSRLQQVTSGHNLFRGEGHPGCTLPAGAAPGEVADRRWACSTRSFMQLAVNFAPQWLQIAPSWDLSLPMTLNVGLRGTAPTGGGGFERLRTFSIGAVATFAAKHEFSLRYSDISVPGRYHATTGALIGGNSLGSSLGATDRGWLVFTYRTSF